MHAEQILSYWFGDADATPVRLDALKARLGLWFGESKETDAHISSTFAAHLEAAAAGQLDAWAETPRGSLALIVLFDQFSRNAYRGTPRAYALDQRALELTEAGLAAGFDKDFNVAHRIAFYLPVMHAEDRALQKRSLELYRRLLAECPEELRPALLLVNDAADRHARIIERFGRYPHRNTSVGRATTPEEAAFLEEADSSYQPPKREGS